MAASPTGSYKLTFSIQTSGSAEGSSTVAKRAVSRHSVASTGFAFSLSRKNREEQEWKAEAKLADNGTAGTGRLSSNRLVQGGRVVLTEAVYGISLRLLRASGN
jgi:hypothetical protein